MSKSDGGEKGKNIDGEDWLLSDSGIGVEDKGNEKSENEKGGEFGGKIVGIFAKEVAIYERPDNSGSDGDFDVFPGGFIDCSEETENFVLVAEIVEKVGKSTESKDYDNTDTKKKWHIHKNIITVVLFFEYSV